MQTMGQYDKVVAEIPADSSSVAFGQRKTTRQCDKGVAEFPAGASASSAFGTARKATGGKLSPGTATTVRGTRSEIKPLAEPNRDMRLGVKPTADPNQNLFDKSSDMAAPPLPQNTAPARVGVAPPTREVATDCDRSSGLASQVADKLVSGTQAMGRGIQRGGRGRNAGNSSVGKVDSCSAVSRNANPEVISRAQAVVTTGNTPLADHARKDLPLPDRKLNLEVDPRARSGAFGHMPLVDPVRKEDLLAEPFAPSPARSASLTVDAAATGGDDTARWLRWNPIETVKDHTWGRPPSPREIGLCVVGYEVPPPAKGIVPPISCRQPPLAPPAQQASGANGGHGRGAPVHEPCNVINGVQTFAQRAHGHGHGNPAANVVPPPPAETRALCENGGHSRGYVGLHADTGGHSLIDNLPFRTIPGAWGFGHGVRLSLGGLPPCKHTPCAAPLDPFGKSVVFDLLPIPRRKVDVFSGLVC